MMDTERKRSNSVEGLIYEKTSVLLMRDCDMYKRIRPSAILTMFQDCSEALTEGWGVGLDAMLAVDVIWVAAKVECSVRRLPLHSELITVRGWACRCRSGIFPFRYTMDDAEGTRLIDGCSMWVLSDLRSHSMLSERIPKITLPTPEPEGAPLPRMAPIRPPREPRQTKRQVRFSELDINGHLTNTRYFDWICDLAPAQFHRTHPITGLRVDYRAETFPDEEITLDWELSDERLYCGSAGRFQAMLTF